MPDVLALFRAYPQLRWVVLCLLAAASVQLHAATAVDRNADEEPWQLIFQLDNDLFSGSDRNYTSGVRMGLIKELGQQHDFHQFLHKQLYALSGADQDSRFRRFSLDKQHLRFAVGTGLTQLMFTPEDSRALRAPEGERPYAGWLGLEFTLQAKTDQQVSGVTLSVGATGTASLAQPSQDWVHTNISGSPIFQGWDSQVPGQLTLNLHFDHKRRLDALSAWRLGGLALDGYYEWGAELGNFRTSAYGGALFRMGVNLPATHSTPRVQLGSYGHQLFRRAQAEASSVSALVFAGVRATAVAYDITLDGPWFRDFDTGVRSRAGVGEFIFGVALRYGIVDLSFSQTARSDEFSGQSANQRFGSVMLRVQTSM